MAVKALAGAPEGAARGRGRAAQARLKPRPRTRHAEAALAWSLPLAQVMADQVIARVDLPGAVPADVTLQVHQTRLLITAGPKGAAQLLKHLEGDTHVVYRRDRGTGDFFRSVLLPGGIFVDDIKASMSDGVLLVTAPAGKGKEQHV